MLGNRIILAWIFTVVASHVVADQPITAYIAQPQQGNSITLLQALSHPNVSQIVLRTNYTVGTEFDYLDSPVFVNRCAWHVNGECRIALYSSHRYAVHDPAMLCVACTSRTRWNVNQILSTGQKQCSQAWHVLFSLGQQAAHWCHDTIAQLAGLG